MQVISLCILNALCTLPKSWGIGVTFAQDLYKLLAQVSYVMVPRYEVASGFSRSDPKRLGRMTACSPMGSCM
ncbi:hypothetical protein F4859DRAFT_473357 [Xylaria cf. heliscus]|nr:hypothetical protein F4859DRAFT_473357 [Xylaria cf. heliscus]